MQIFFIKLSADVKFLLNLFETKYHFNITKSSNIKQFMFCGMSHKKTLVLSVSKVSWVNKLLLETWQGARKSGEWDSQYFKPSFQPFVNISHSR